MSVRILTMQPRVRRHRRLRARLAGTSQRPRLAVFRSLRHISAQLIDDTLGETLLFASDSELTKKAKQTKSEQANAVGALIAEKASVKKITTIVFDRGGYRYHGRIKSLAEGARAGGLLF
ncbi:MAG: 50S ribosomal protein L18 [Patescibacteria group bacterium]